MTIYIQIDSVPAKLKLAIQCWQCAGEGTAIEESWANDDGSCNLCDGAGLRITSNGKAILNLLKIAPRGDNG